MTAKTPGKNTVYVDVDDEITAIIDKVRSSPNAIVALVLPKRAAVFQSIVNMKLLKRAAEQDSKKVVLITSEPSILPLAGTVGLHVAHNLNSKPYLPTMATPVDESEQTEEPPAEIDRTAPIGSVVEDEIEIDNTPKEAAAPLVAKKAKGKSKLRVPDFNKFRTLLIVGGIALVLIIIFAYWALAIAPKATVVLRGETSDAQLSFGIVADTAASELDEEQGIVPAKSKELKKTESEKVPATGQKDKGNKASGTVSLKNCSKTDGNITIPAGTGVSSSDLTFITQTPITLPASEFSGGGSCKTETKDVAVIAQQAGDRYNVGSRSYTVAGISGVTGTGSAMTGGTSQVVKVVSASDVENAKQKLAAKQGSATEELKATLDAEGYVGVTETFESKAPSYNPSPAVDSEGTEVVVTAETTYTMLGLKKDELKKLIEKEADREENIDTSKQKILSDGLKTAVFQIGSKKATKTNINLQTKVVAGPEIDQEAIKKEIMGKKRGEAEQILKARPGIKEARIETSPFWSYSIPKKASKITFTIEEADGSKITE
jgi:hypothetical protein